MKIINSNLSLIITFWLLGCSFSQRDRLISLNATDPNLKQHGKYLMCKEMPFEGIVNEKFENGEFKSQAKYKSGLLNGQFITWYLDGKIESSRYYELGEKEGTHLGWWQNGNPRFEYQFSMGLYHGMFKEWYENGKPLHVFEYDHGNEVRAIGWRDNGKTYINFAVRNGKKYGLTNARLCYSLKDEQGLYKSSNN